MSRMRAGRERGRVSESGVGVPATLKLLPFALLAASPCAAETAQPSGPGTQLPGVTVTAPRPSAPARRAPPAPQPAPQPGPALEAPAAAPSLLNLNTVAESASRLGLTPRQTPATVEILEQQQIQEQGYRTTTEAAAGFTGVTAGDAPGAPASFSMRGFSGTQINTLYNGIKVGPSEMTGRFMDTFNLDRIEILKGPASLMSGEGATAGAINYVTRVPHTGPVVNEAFTSWDSFNGYRLGYGSGGSTTIKGLDYRFDVARSSLNSFIDDTYTKLLTASGQLNYQVNNSLKIWGAAEYREDKERLYYGTPLVPANFPGIIPTRGIVSGLWTQHYPGPFDFAGRVGPLNPVTIDARTLRTTYNVLDNKSGAEQKWLRGGFEYSLTNNVTIKSQFYLYDAQRHWFNNEYNAFNDSPTPTLGAQGEIYRERLAIDHDQRLYGNITDIILNSNIAGMDNRSAVTFAANKNRFNVAQDTLFTSDTVSLINPIRGLYGPRLDEHIFTNVNNISLAFEDRLKVTPTFALVGGVRGEQIELSRDRFNPDGTRRAGFPFSHDFNPVTGRIGYTWDALPGLTFYSQYATAADPAVANIFILRPTQPLVLTTSRTYETGVKQVMFDNRFEWTFAAYEIERSNVFVPDGNQNFNLAGRIKSKGIELAAAARPFDGLKVWGNVAFVESRFADFDNVIADEVVQSFSGNTPPNIPKIVANAGAAYRFATWWPVEIGAAVRHVGDRFNANDNLVIMNAYTIADAWIFLDIPKSTFRLTDFTRLAFRVRNLGDKKYAIWSDTAYLDQVILGPPRTYEVSASFRF